jgi:geranylgeranyl diphosphate synthase, type II
MPLEEYRARIDQELAVAVEQMGDPSPLRDACAYALLNGGKRLRPMLVYLIAEAMGCQRNVSAAALSVEYFHTASLIADDLPCMDNDDIRRNQPALHKVFGETIALLSSYTLVAAGYGAIYDASRGLKNQFPEQTAQIDAMTAICLETVSQCAGLRGATHGQFLDLFPPDQSIETILTIILRKTATLFEISFVLGWLFGGGCLQRLEEVKQCARHLGVSFQIADDIQDFIQDKKSSSINIARVLGEELARERFNQELQGLNESLQSLGLWTKPFQQISKQLSRSFYDRYFP